MRACPRPCRVSIVAGQIFHHRDHESNFDVVVGPSPVETHELEKSVAVYPRIIVGSSGYNFWEEYMEAAIERAVRLLAYYNMFPEEY